MIAFMLSLMVIGFTIQIPVFAKDSTVYTATQWEQVQGLIDNAAEHDIVDISALCSTTANVTLTISKNITVKVEPSGKSFAETEIKNLFFNLNNNATLTLENVAITNNQLDKSVILGTGNAVISKSILQPSTENGTTTVYHAPATIEIAGDVTVTTDADLFSCIVAGATILDRSNGNTGKAGDAIHAVNVTVNGGMVQGGASFQSSCDSGDAIVASGNVTINNNAEVQAGAIGDDAQNTTVGLPLRFTENPNVQRVLFMQNAHVFGSSRNSSGYAAPYTVKMSAKDIAIIDSSKIGWYTDMPVFSDGFYYITNPVNTWGTLDDATEVYILNATNATLTGTKTVKNGDDVTHYAPKDATITIQADTPATGKQFKKWTVVSGNITLANSKSAKTTFKMPAEAVEVTATYEDIPPHTHTASGTWSEDAVSHWHECIDNDGEKMDAASHTFGNWEIDTPATETTKGSKHRDCTVCGHRETEAIPATDEAPEKPAIIAGAGSTHQINNGKDMTLTCSGELDDLADIYVDGKLIDESNYTLKSGSTILTLKTSYLDTLSVGKHTLKFQYVDNVSAETDFTITVKTGDTSVNPSIPQTGDTSSKAFNLALFVLSGCVVGFELKKKKYLNK